MTSERIYRWEIGIVGALILAAVGIAIGRPVALIAGAVPLTYAVFESMNRLPDEPQVEFERKIEESTPAPGEQVKIRLYVRNCDNVVLTDIRVIDAVPDDLSVVDGSPRAGISLRPGGEVVVEYTVVSRRGSYDFDEPYVRLKSLSGAHRQTFRIPINGDESIECHTGDVDAPVQIASDLRAGAVASDAPGQGLEFYSLRDYRTGDQLSRVDWRHYAKTGDLTTIQFHEQRAASVLAVVDARSSTRVSPAPGNPDGIELTTYAAVQTIGSLFAAGHRVGVTALGVNTEAVDTPIYTDRAGAPWVEPGTDPDTRARVDALFEAVEISASDEPSGATQRVRTDGGTETAERLLEHIDDGTQVFVFSPAIDDTLVSLVRRLRVSGREVTLVSPDPTRGSGAGTILASFDRRVRLGDLRAIDTQVVDWHPNEPLQTALEMELNLL